MQTKPILMYVAVAILVGSIVSMTTSSEVFAAQTGNSNNSNTNANSNSNTNDCPENGSGGDDADEPGDNDVNDEEDTDTGNEDEGEANDDEEEEEQNGSTGSTSADGSGGGATNQISHKKFDPCDFSNEEIIDNPYLTFTPGTTFTYESETEEGTEEDIVVVTDETKEILGVTARVVRDTVSLDGELIEDTFDWFAQDKEGNVWYLGEDTKEYENGEVVSTEGSWEAGVDGAEAGIIMLADPQVGDTYRQEWYPGVAEDAAEVISLNEEVTVPYGTFTNCLQTREFSTLDPELNEYKFYCPDVGGVTLEEVIDSDERVELIDVNAGEANGEQQNGGTDDADEPGDNDVNDEEDTDTGNEDEGEANDDEEEE
jgi:uncharacterized protein YuzE